MLDERIGLIGLGLLGSAIAERLMYAGIRIKGFDLNPDRQLEFEHFGGLSAMDARQIASECKFILLILPNSDVVHAVIDQIQGHIHPECMVMDATTGDPQATVSAWKKLESIGISYVDTTVVGSSQQVRDSKATILLGASHEAAERVLPILRAIAPQVFRVGEVGAAAKMKLVVNLAIGLHRTVLAEALTLAKALGLSGTAALAVMKATSAYSRMMDSKGEKMLSGDFTPQARLAQHLKDVRLMLAAAREAGTNLPLSEVNEQLLEKLVQAGLGDLDNSAVIRAYDGLPRH